MNLLFNIGFLKVSFIDILDILLVSFLLYQLYKVLRGSVAVRIFLGLAFIYLFYLLVSSIGMDLLSDILGQFIGVGVLAAIILFQQEIRKFLLLVGKSTSVNNERISKLLHFGKGYSNSNQSTNFDSIIQAVQELGETKTGALIAITNLSKLKEYTDTGDILNANVSTRLLLSIFNKNSPMHDGAVIISGDQIIAARCIVPVTESNLAARYGMRHRAAVGLSEVSESPVIVVSEETGEISLAHRGELFAGIDAKELRHRINQILRIDSVEKKPTEKS